MDDDSREQSTLESSIPSGPSALRQNEQVSEEVQPVWKLYRKPTPSPDSDVDSDASETSSDGSVQWEKNFIGKLVKVKKQSCLHEITGPASEDLEGCPVKQELIVFCKSNPDSNCDNHLLQEREELTPNLNQDVKGVPMKHELLCSCELELDKKCSCYQLKAPKKQIQNLKKDVTGSPEKHELSLSHDLSLPGEPSNCHLCNMSLPQTSSHPGEYSNCQQNSSEEATTKLNEPPECSVNCQVSSSCDSREMQGVKQLRSDIGTEGHTSDEPNLGYVSRWTKEPPGSPSHCEVSSSCDSESDDEHIGSHKQERERQNCAPLQQMNSDLMVTGTAESEKMIESPRNCQVSSSCESDSDASGYSKLCLRVSEDSVEDDTDHSSGKEKRDKSRETSADRKDGDDEHINVTHKQSKYVEPVKVPTQTLPLCPRIKKKRSISHPRHQASYSQLDSNKHSHEDQQWTRDFIYRDRPARLRSQSPVDRVGRWRRSQSPLEPCRKLRSRSVLSIRDTQGVTLRKRRSKSCDTYSKHKLSHEGSQPSKEHALLKGMESESETPSNNGMKRQSRSPRRRWTKSASSTGKYKTSSRNSDKYILQMTSGNSESLSVGIAARSIHCNNIHKFQEEQSVPASECSSLGGLLGKSHVSQTEMQNVSEELLTSRTRRALSRSRSMSNIAQRESVAESVPTKKRHRMSELHMHSREKEEPLEVCKEYMTKQSQFLNTSKINNVTTKKKDSLKEHITTISSDSVIQNTPRIFTRFNKCHKLSQEQPTSGSKLTIQVSQNRSTANSSKNKQVSSEESSFKSICSQTHGSSSKFLHSAPENAFRRNTCSHRGRRSAPVNTSRRQSRRNTFQEIQDQSTFSNTHGLLMKCTDKIHLHKGKKLSDDCVADSSCFMSGSDAKKHTKSKKNQELAGNTLLTKTFLGFPEEEVSLNSILSLPTIISESCECPVSAETLLQVHSTNKTRHSGSVLTHGTLSSLSEDKMASELLGSSDSKHLLRRLSRKRKFSNEVCQPQNKSHTSESLFSFLSGSCGKETESDIADGRPMLRYPSHNSQSLLRRNSGARENQEHLSKRRELGKFKQSAEAAQSQSDETAQSTLQSKQVEVNKKAFRLHQIVACNSRLQLGHSSAAVNEPAAVNEIPHPPSRGISYTKVSETDSSLFKDANAIYVATASDTTMVKCSSQERICCKEDNALLGSSMSFIKPCSVVLKNIVLSSVYDKYVNKNEKFVFPPFPHVTSVTKLSVFRLPQDYMNTVWKKGK